VFEKRVPRGIFSPKRNEVTGDWRKLHNVELHNLYSSPNIIRMINISNSYVENRDSEMILVGNPEGKETTRTTET
jgi:hypothetical protein